MKLKILSNLFILVFCLPLYGMSICELNLLGVEEHNKYFEVLIKNSSKRFKSLERNAEYFKSSKLLNEDIKGQVNYGIFTIENNGNREDVKFLASFQNIDSYGYKIIMQEHFGDLGISPKVKGLFLKDSVRKISKLNKLPKLNYSTIGIIMEKLNKGVLIKFDVLKTGATWHELYPKSLDFLTQESLNSVKNQIKDIEKILNDLHILAQDAQFHITEEGKVYLIDFDFYDMNLETGFDQSDFQPNNFDQLLDYIDSFK